MCINLEFTQGGMEIKVKITLYSYLANFITIF